MRVGAVGLRDQVFGEDGTSVVMIDRQVLVLSALATEAMTALAAGPRDVEEVVAHLRRIFGDPEGEGAADALVHDLLRELIARGVVRVVTTE